MRYVGVMCLVFIISGCATKPNVIAPVEPFSGLGTHRIYVASHGWHTGLILPYKIISSQIPELSDRFKHASYIEFGWGDKGFYQAKEITTGLTLQAIFVPTESVIHAVSVDGDVRAYFQNSDVETLLLTDTELLSLIEFVSSSFARDDDNNLIASKLGIYGDSQFYKAVGDYYLFNTCNKWTAKGLKSMGMDISTTFKLTSHSVMNFVRDHGVPEQIVHE